MKISKIAMLIKEPEVILEDKGGMFQLVSRETLFRDYCLNDIDSLSLGWINAKVEYIKITVKENIWA